MYRSRAAPAAAASRATDVYAFGTLMHEVLSNRVPWKDYSEMDRLAALRDRENLDLLLLPKDTPASVVAIINLCLSFERTQRPRMTEVLAVLEQAHEDAVSGCFDVFLSYAWGPKGARKPLADKLYRVLRTSGLRVWKDDLEMGHDLQQSMSDGIAKSEVVVLLLSADYARSSACLFEARSAAASGKPIVTCVVEPGPWRLWGLDNDGCGSRVLPDDHELVALAQLKTHLFVDLSAASTVKWEADVVTTIDSAKLTLPEALPRLLSLIKAARAQALSKMDEQAQAQARMQGHASARTQSQAEVQAQASSLLLPQQGQKEAKLSPEIQQSFQHLLHQQLIMRRHAAFNPATSSAEASGPPDPVPAGAPGETSPGPLPNSQKPARSWTHVTESATN
jgi:hypothetical protein